MNTTPEIQPISIRLPEALDTEVKSAAARLTLTKAATLRLAIQRGLPLVLQQMGVAPVEVPIRTAGAVRAGPAKASHPRAA